MGFNRNVSLLVSFLFFSFFLWHRLQTWGWNLSKIELKWKWRFMSKFLSGDDHIIKNTDGQRHSKPPTARNASRTIQRNRYETFISPKRLQIWKKSICIICPNSKSKWARLYDNCIVRQMEADNPGECCYASSNLFGWSENNCSAYCLKSTLWNRISWFNGNGHH